MQQMFYIWTIIRTRATWRTQARKCKRVVLISRRFNLISSKLINFMSPQYFCLFLKYNIHQFIVSSLRKLGVMRVFCTSNYLEYNVHLIAFLYIYTISISFFVLLKCTRIIKWFGRVKYIRDKEHFYP